MKKYIIAAAASLVVIGLVVPASAFASHFRASFGSVAVSGSTLTWTVDSAWRSDSASDIGSPSVLTVPNPSAAPITPVNGGTSTAYSVTSADPVYDYSNPLYTTTTESHQLDLSALIDDGTYELFASSCCRVGGVSNTNDETSFSQWIRFTKTGSTYNLPPSFTSPTLYALITPGTTTSADFTATDPEGGAVTYTAITDTTSPYLGGEALACSSLVNGRLTLDPSLCTSGDVFADIYTPGSYWTAKVQASDAQGNIATVDTLFRVMTPPEPYIDNAEASGNGLDYAFTAFAPDTIVSSYTITCTNTMDATDIVSGTSATSPLTLGRFTNGESYTCDSAATNAAGTGTNTDQYGIGPVILVGVNLNLQLAVGATFQGASTVISGGGLKAASAYNLTMHSEPIIIDQGTTDAQGNFTNAIRIPAAACLVGIHELILTGIDPQGNPVTDTQWIELGANCDVLNLSRTEIKPPALESLPKTGVKGDQVALLAGGGFALALLGGAVVFATRRRKKCN